MKGNAVGCKDVREWIQKVGEMGELRVIEGEVTGSITATIRSTPENAKDLARA
jgi:hypothetical protein